MYSDRRPFTPSLTTNGNIDENERGRQLLATPLPDKLGDSPRDFLAEFDQQTSNHDGDNNILSLSFSPSPFFSTILPGSHPSELIHPSSAKTSDSFLTPPLSTGGDEIPWYFPPTKQCQGWSSLQSPHIQILTLRYSLTCILISTPSSIRPTTAMRMPSRSHLRSRRTRSKLQLRHALRPRFHRRIRKGSRQSLPIDAQLRQLHSPEGEPCFISFHGRETRRSV